jgi:type II restriction/modification system DNA methylase subunit YeeA
LETIECRDALLNPDGTEAEWPEADVIIGNPPFLGDRKVAPALGVPYSDTLRDVFQDRMPRGVDLVCYWFAKAHCQLIADLSTRFGFVATNSIRGGRNREVLAALEDPIRIFVAWSDEPWVIDGAAVRVSVVCATKQREDVGSALDGMAVASIYPDLTSGNTDLTLAVCLTEAGRTAYQGVISYGPFEVTGEEARQLLQRPINPNGRSNREVVRPWINGQDITRRPDDHWIVFFPDSLTEAEAALFEAPFSLAAQRVRPYRLKRDNAELNKHWWRLWRSRGEYFERAKPLHRVIITPRVAKHRLFVWRASAIVPDSAIVAIARDDDTSFGILHSKFHELWSLRLGTSLEDRPRYTPTTCFETFPFPEGLTPNIPAADYANDPRAIAIAKAAARLNELRENWLNPPDLVQRVPEVVPGYPDRILPVDEKAAAILKKRTLTNLYNERPAWLDMAHKDLDAAVAAAYGWPADLSDDEILERLFKLNQERAAKQS